MNILDINGASLIFEGLKGTGKVKSILQNKKEDLINRHVLN